MQLGTIGIRDAPDQRVATRKQQGEAAAQRGEGFHRSHGGASVQFAEHGGEWQLEDPSPRSSVACSTQFRQSSALGVMT